MVDIARRRLFSRGPKAVINTELPQRMPWLVDEQAFVSGCTRCGRCLQACETSVIVQGEAGFPEVCFDNGECTFCGKCAEACPEPLFLSLQQKPWNQVAVISDRCLSLNAIECRSCGDMCEYAAIRFRLQAGGTAKPVLNVEDCTGCGACIRPCPVNAITINRTGKADELSR